MIHLKISHLDIKIHLSEPKGTSVTSSQTVAEQELAGTVHILCVTDYDNK